MVMVMMMVRRLKVVMRMVRLSKVYFLGIANVSTNVSTTRKKETDEEMK